MKKHHLILATLFCLPMAAKSQALISGTWERRHDGNVHLYRVEHGRLEEIAASKPGKDSAFGFYFQPPQEGFYVIGTGNINSPIDKYNFYLKPNDKLNVKINDSSYVLTGKNTSENVALEKWHQLTLPLERRGVYFTGGIHSTYVDFFPLLEKINGEISRTKFAATGNVRFDREFAMYREMNLLLDATEMVNTPRTAHPVEKDYPAYYRTIDMKHYTPDTRLLRYPFGTRLLTGIQSIDARLGKKSPTDNGIESRMNGILNDTLKGEVVLQQTSWLKTYLGYTDLMKDYGKYILTADQQVRSKAMAAKLAQTATGKGEPALNFTYPDLAGKKVSLTDFKGKVVLVDVWATWCGPCKQQIPSLKELEKDMHGKDVVFMSVSVDEDKDHQKWKDFVGSEQLGGVQLFASGWSDIAKLYNIKGIPRFMVFDKNGNIVSTDAPRPSGTELKLLLESELKK